MGVIFIGGNQFFQFDSIGFSDILKQSTYPGAIYAPLS
jgi:hypothetical protein